LGQPFVISEIGAGLLAFASLAVGVQGHLNLSLAQSVHLSWDMHVFFILLEPSCKAGNPSKKYFAFSKNRAKCGIFGLKKNMHRLVGQCNCSLPAEIKLEAMM